MLVKRLIVIDPAARRPVGSLALRRPLVVSPECGLIDLLNAFQEGRSHLALVAKEPHAALDWCVLFIRGSIFTSDAALGWN